MERASGRVGAVLLLLGMLLASPLRAAVTIESVLPFTPAGQRKPVWSGDFGRANVRAGATPTFEKVLEKLAVHPWTPATPHLYELTVTASENRKPVATRTVRLTFTRSGGS